MPLTWNLVLYLCLCLCPRISLGMLAEEERSANGARSQQQLAIKARPDLLPEVEELQQPREVLVPKTSEVSASLVEEGGPREELETCSTVQCPGAGSMLRSTVFMCSQATRYLCAVGPLTACTCCGCCGLIDCDAIVPKVPTLKTTAKYSSPDLVSYLYGGNGWGSVPTGSSIPAASETMDRGFTPFPSRSQSRVRLAELDARESTSDRSTGGSSDWERWERMTGSPLSDWSSSNVDYYPTDSAEEASDGEVLRRESDSDDDASILRTYGHSAREDLGEEAQARREIESNLDQDVLQWKTLRAKSEDDDVVSAARTYSPANSEASFSPTEELGHGGDVEMQSVSREMGAQRLSGLGWVPMENMQPSSGEDGVRRRPSRNPTSAAASEEENGM